MEEQTVIHAAQRFNPSMGSKAERAQQVLVIQQALQTFIDASIELMDALSFDFDAEDDDPDHEHDGAEQQQGDICAHYQIDQRIPISLSPWSLQRSMPVTEDTIL